MEVQNKSNENVKDLMRKLDGISTETRVDSDKLLTIFEEVRNNYFDKVASTEEDQMQLAYAVGYSYDNIRICLEVIFDYIYSVNKKIKENEIEFHKLFDILVKEKSEYVR